MEPLESQPQDWRQGGVCGGVTGEKACQVLVEFFVFMMLVTGSNYVRKYLKGVKPPVVFG